jgi:hypothetical protein
LPPAMTRRAVLGGAAVVALGGCAQADPRIPPPKPDVAVLTGAIAAEERLIALYQAARNAVPGLAGRLDPALAHHREHLAVLRRHYLPGTGGVTAPPVPVPPPTVPADDDHVVKLVRDAESEAAAARLADVARVAPGMAQLLAGIGACEAGHAAALSRSER